MTLDLVGQKLMSAVPQHWTNMHYWMFCSGKSVTVQVTDFNKMTMEISDVMSCYIFSEMLLREQGRLWLLIYFCVDHINSEDSFLLWCNTV